MRTLDVALQAEQASGNVSAGYQITVNSVTYTGDNIRWVFQHEGTKGQEAVVVLDNSDGSLSAVAYKGLQLTIGWGTTATNAYSSVAPLWVMEQHEDRWQGVLALILYCEGIPNRLQRDEASNEFQPERKDPTSVKTYLQDILKFTSDAHPDWAAATLKNSGDYISPVTKNGLYYKATVSGTTGAAEPTWPLSVGLTVADSSVTWQTWGKAANTIYGHCAAYTATFDSGEALLTSLTPADAFQVGFREDRWTATQKLLSYVQSVARAESNSALHIIQPTVSGTAYSYTYDNSGPLSVERLYPAGSGDSCTIGTETGSACPNHYANVGEASPDEDTTTVQSEAVPTAEYDFYAIGTPAVGNGPIHGIILSIRCRKNATSIPANLWASAGATFKTGGTAYMATISGTAVSSSGFPDVNFLTQVTDSYATYSTLEIETNPGTGVAWTWTDITALQIGVALRRSENVGISLHTYCTQVYVDVIYTPHTFLEKKYGGALITPNYVQVSSMPDDGTQYTAATASTADNALLDIRTFRRLYVSSTAQANSVGVAIVAKLAMEADKGYVVVPMNCGQEVYDYVRVIDSGGNNIIGNVSDLIRVGGEGRFHMAIRMGDMIGYRTLPEMPFAITPEDFQSWFQNVFVSSLNQRIQSFTDAERRFKNNLNSIAASVVSPVIRKTANQIVNASTAVVDDTHLLKDIRAYEMWEMTFVVHILQGNSITPKFQYALTVPAGCTVVYGGTYEALAGTATDQASTVSGSVMSVDTVANEDKIVMVKAIVRNGANDGTVQFQWAQKVATTVDTTVVRGSCIIPHRLA